MDEPHIWLKPLKLVFSDLKDKFPLNFKAKYSAVQHSVKAYRFTPFLAPVKFRWIMPFGYILLYVNE